MKHRTILLLCLAIIIVSLTAVGHLEAKNEAAIQELKADKPMPVKTVHIATPEPAPIETPEAEPEPTPYITLTAEETDLLATTAYFEDNLHGMEGLTAVLHCIRNRLADGRFGGDIASICTTNQFHGLVRMGAENASEDAYRAVGEVFTKGAEDTTNGGLYFCTAATDPDKIKSGLTETARAGGHVFYTDLEDKP